MIACILPNQNSPELTPAAVTDTPAPSDEYRINHPPCGRIALGSEHMGNL